MNYMNKKSWIYLGVGAMLALGGWLIYRNNRNNKIDATPVPLDEALEKLEKINLFYIYNKTINK